jgi:curli biogenesis system outer membrane secretion channel CsgG
MVIPLLILGLILQADPAAAKTQAPSSQASAKVDPDVGRGALLKIKRIFVDSFGDDQTSKEVQSLIVSALVATNQFTVTENRERADAVLKGVALEKTSQELHAYSEGTAVGGRNGGAAIKDSAANTETIREAKVGIRLVNPDGDVVWTSTQESKGGKYKGATADAADKCVKQLLRDVEKLKGADASNSGTTAPGASTGNAEKK